MLECSYCDYFLWIGVVLGLLIVFKLYIYLTTGIYTGKIRLDGKTAIVTGANSGIGLETVRDFARRGARVLMVCRDMVKAERVREEIFIETGNNKLILKHIDLSSLDSVRKCANQILSEESRIDILVNNAGIGESNLQQTEDGLGNVMQPNYFGPFLFTNILLGKIKQSAPSRIVNVSSVTYKLVNIDLNNIKKSKRTNTFLLYAESKLANIYFSNELANKLKGTGVTSNCLHPGVFSSGISRNMNKISIVITDILLKIFFKSTQEAAQTSIYLSVSPDIEKITGKYFADCKIQKLWSHARDMNIAKKIWNITEEAVNLLPNEKHY